MLAEVSLRPNLRAPVAGDSLRKSRSSMNSHGDSLISLEYRYHKFSPAGEIPSEVVRFASKHGMIVTVKPGALFPLPSLLVSLSLPIYRCASQRINRIGRNNLVHLYINQTARSATIRCGQIACH